MRVHLRQFSNDFMMGLPVPKPKRVQDLTSGTMFKTLGPPRPNKETTER